MYIRRHLFSTSLHPPPSLLLLLTSHFSLKPTTRSSQEEKERENEKVLYRNTTTRCRPKVNYAWFSNLFSLSSCLSFVFPSHPERTCSHLFPLAVAPFLWMMERSLCGKKSYARDGRREGIKENKWTSERMLSVAKMNRREQNERIRKSGANCLHTVTYKERLSCGGKGVPGVKRLYLSCSSPAIIQADSEGRREDLCSGWCSFPPVPYVVADTTLFGKWSREANVVGSGGWNKEG